MKSFGFCWSYKFVVSMCTPIVIMAWLNCWNSFCWFHYGDTKDIVFAWFGFLVFMNCFELLFVEIILEVWLIVCFESFSFFTSQSPPNITFSSFSNSGMGGTFSSPPFLSSNFSVNNRVLRIKFLGLFLLVIFFFLYIFF